jgi:hypothetical protein
MTTCAICRGAIPTPRGVDAMSPDGRICRRCHEARGALTTSAWLERLRATNSTLLIDHRVANDVEFEREVGHVNGYRH